MSALEVFVSRGKPTNWHGLRNKQFPTLRKLFTPQTMPVPKTGVKVGEPGFINVRQREEHYDQVMMVGRNWRALQ